MDMAAPKALKSVKKLKEKIMNVSDVLEAYHKACERQQELERQIMEERKAAKAARASAGSSDEGQLRARLEQAQRASRSHEDAAAASARRVDQLEEELRGKTEAASALQVELSSVKKQYEGALLQTRRELAEALEEADRVSP